MAPPLNLSSNACQPYNGAERMIWWLTKMKMWMKMKAWA